MNESPELKRKKTTKVMGHFFKPSSPERLDLLEDYYNLGIYAFFMDDNTLMKKLQFESDLNSLRRRSMASNGENSEKENEELERREAKLELMNLEE